MSERARGVLESMRIRQFNQKPIKPVFLSEADLFSEVIEHHKRFQTLLKYIGTSLNYFIIYIKLYFMRKGYLKAYFMPSFPH